MKILHLVHAYEDIGGILSMVRNLIRGDSANEHFMVVNREFVQKRDSAATMLQTRWAVDESESKARLLVGLLDVGAIRRLIRENGIDVVHAHTRGAYPILLALGAGIPRVASIHCYAHQTSLYRSAVKNSKVHWVFATQAMLRHYELLAMPANASLIPACYDSAGVAAALDQCAAEPARDTGRVKLVGVGYFWERKKWHVLIEAVSRLEPAIRRRLSIDIYGDATTQPSSIQYKNNLLDLLEKTKGGDVVSLCGTTPNNLPAVAEADWLAMPSVNEPCSVAVLEAIGLGTPVLGAKSGGTGDIIKEGLSGHLIRPDDVGDLASALVACADRTLPHGSREEIRAAARPYSNFSVAAEYSRLYNRLANPAA